MSFDLYLWPQATLAGDVLPTELIGHNQGKSRDYEVPHKPQINVI